MIKSIHRLEHAIGDKVFHLYVPAEAQLGEIWDALHHFREFILQSMQSSMCAKNENINVGSNDDTKSEM